MNVPSTILFGVELQTDVVGGKGPFVKKRGKTGDAVVPHRLCGPIYLSITFYCYGWIPGTFAPTHPPENTSTSSATQPMTIPPNVNIGL